MVKNEYKSMYQAEQEKKMQSQTAFGQLSEGDRLKVSRSFKRGFGTINNLKRAIVLATASHDALNTLSKSSPNYQQTYKMMEENILQANKLILSLENDYRNIHHSFKEGSENID